MAQARQAPVRSRVRSLPPAEEARRRVIIRGVRPEVEGGRYPIKRTPGEKVVVEADIFLDGHDEIACVIQHRRSGDKTWQETPMQALLNDHWRGEFQVGEAPRYEYRIEAWPDPFASWRRDLKKRLDAGQDVSIELLAGAQLVRAAAGRATEAEARRLEERANALEKDWDVTLRAGIALDDSLLELMERFPDRTYSTIYEKWLPVQVDRERARFSAWYEMFPRSTSPEPSRPGTFQDCIDRLPYVQELGFDVLYLPPIHPVGRTHRKGRNNAVESREEDPGSPWAIGSREGGHKAINPELGTLKDFRRLVGAANDMGIEIALDLAYQCSPDHPYVREHPQWFKHRPDGSIRYAENPPKKYEDIYPIDFETDDWEALWEELKSIVTYWASQGVRIFRVDNPHTKSFRFWEWMIAEAKKEYPDLIFLSEAFTRPNLMYHLAKIGFTQSYTYFTWRNAKWDLTDYLTELTQSEVREFFRPNFWPNTPDILHEYLQVGGRPAFIARLVLAATMSANYGMYGPAFELMENVPREHGSEEYLNSEKYEIRHWDLDRPDSLRDLIARINQIRREHEALQSNFGLQFVHVDNDQLIAYTRSNDDGSDVILTVVSLDPGHAQAGWVSLPLHELGIDAGDSYQVHDLLDDSRYIWRGPTNFVQLIPQVMSAHIFRILR
jgi:starch synthase (maltosyl-transferring)